MAFGQCRIVEQGQLSLMMAVKFFQNQFVIPLVCQKSLRGGPPAQKKRVLFGDMLSWSNYTMWLLRHSFLWLQVVDRQIAQNKHFLPFFVIVATKGEIYDDKWLLKAIFAGISHNHISSFG